MEYFLFVRNQSSWISRVNQSKECMNPRTNNVFFPLIMMFIINTIFWGVYFRNIWIHELKNMHLMRKPTKIWVHEFKFIHNIWVVIFNDCISRLKPQTTIQWWPWQCLRENKQRGVKCNMFLFSINNQIILMHFNMYLYTQQL